VVRAVLCGKHGTRKHEQKSIKLMKITRIDPFTKKENTMELDITQDQLDAWQNGTLIQDAFPELNADQREFIMTGITAESWDNAFNLNSEKD